MEFDTFAFLRGAAALQIVSRSHTFPIAKARILQDCAIHVCYEDLIISLKIISYVKKRILMHCVCDILISQP